MAFPGKGGTAAINGRKRRVPGGANRRVGGRKRIAQATDRVLLYGIHSVAAAIQNPARSCHHLYATENARRKLAAYGPSADMLAAIPETTTSPREIDRLVVQRAAHAGAVHQGVALEVSPLPCQEIDALAGSPLLVALDQITDPQNIGAILRSAAAFGVGGIIGLQRGFPEESGALAKAASGALEIVPLIRAPNLRRMISRLDDSGYQTIALDGEAEMRLDQLAFRPPVLMVLGAEGKGVRAGVKAACGVRARLPVAGVMPHLNVSNAAAVALHIIRQSLENGSS